MHLKPLICGGIAIVCAMTAAAQTGGLSGTIHDPSGAVIPHAEMTVTNTGTQASRKTSSNSQGIYAVPSLPPGEYEAHVAAPGFQPATRTSLVLEVGQSKVVDFVLQVGETQQSVSVSGDVSTINVQGGSVSTVVNRQFIENMPLNGRSFQSLIELVPGVVAANASGNNPGQFSINGQRSDTNYFTIDGASAHVGVGTSGAIATAGSGASPGVATTGGFNSLVSVDALQEFQIQTSTFAPEYGRTPGGQIVIVTRSGGNQFHGNAFDYLRNDFFDATDWFANYASLAKPPLRQNDFGGTFGGPILKNRLFFFLSYEGLRLAQSTPLSAIVPSVSARTTPANNTAAAAAVLPYLQSYPLPNGGLVDANLAILNANVPTTNQLDAGSVRVDYHINDHMTLFGRYNNAPSESLSRSLTGLTTVVIPTTTFTAGHTWNLLASMVNDFRFNYSTSAGLRTADGPGTFMGAIPLPAAQAFPNPSETAAQGAAFNFAPNSANGLGAVQVNNHPGNNHQRQINVVDSFSVIKGSHQLKFGVDWRQLTPVFEGMPYRATATMISEAHVFQGIIDRLQIVTEPGYTYRISNYSAYGQDTWKATQRLTLTYGLRWDINPAPTSPNATAPFALSHFDPNNLGATTAASLGTAPYSTSFKAFSPRLGIAYQLSTDPRWQRVLRSGFGLFYDTANDISGQINGPYVTSKTVSFASPNFLTYPLSGNPNLVPSAAVVSPPFNTGAKTTIPNLELPYFYQFNAAIEQSLWGPSQTISATYVGMVGRRLLRTQSYNVTNPAVFPNGLTTFTNGGTSDYHALQLQYQKRLSHGLQVLANYSWAHSIDTSSEYTAGFAGLSSASVNPAQDRGPSNFDIRHSVHLAISYDLPSLHTSNRFAHGILGGWALDSIYQFRTAPPFDLNAAPYIDPVTGITIYSRPSIVPGQPVWLYGNVCPQPLAPSIFTAGCPGGRRLNPAAFVNPPVGQQGNYGRNSLRGFGLQQVDMALRRDIPIRERFHLQFRADLFNILNHPNFGPPDLFVSDGPARFGIVQSTLANALYGFGGYSPSYNLGGPRSIQLSMKLVF